MIFNLSWITKRKTPTLLVPLIESDLRKLLMMLILMLQAWKVFIKPEECLIIDQELLSNYSILNMSSLKKISEFCKTTILLSRLLWKKLWLDMSKVWKKITLCLEHNLRIITKESHSIMMSWIEKRRSKSISKSNLDNKFKNKWN